MHSSTLFQKIEANQEVIGIIGLGYVGLPLAVSFAQAGIKVLGFDKSQGKVDKINHGDNYIKDIRDAVLREVVENITLTATTDFTKIKECDALLICVPTPLDKFRKPDMSYIESACISIGHHMKPGTFISLESTTCPTTTEEFMLPIIEQKSGLKHGQDFWIAYSPERENPRNSYFNIKTSQKVLGNIDVTGLEIGQKLYSKAINHLHLVLYPVSEMAKVNSIISALNSQKKAMNGSKILFLGVASKSNIDNAMESPELKIMDIVANKGGKVSYYDPLYRRLQHHLGGSFNLLNVP
jgi:UDP-N-acetyl-D-glucosamine dehydrogenase